MAGLVDNVYMPFGRNTHKGKPVGDVPSGYLKWCLEKDWVYNNHPKLVEAIKKELAWRTEWDKHFEKIEDFVY